MTKDLSQALLMTVATQVVAAADFADLCARCFGAWPARIADAVRQLAASGGSARIAAARIVDRLESPVISRVRHDVRLPLGHPLDGDWRFTPETASWLLDCLELAAGPCGMILLVGLPTVVLAAVDRGIDHRLVCGVREHDPVSDALRRCTPRARFVDLDELCDVAADCGAVDPPWYDDIAVPLIQRASLGVRAGGCVFTCGPDWLTGPSSASVMRSPAGHKGLFGLTTAGFIGRARYETPLFEMRALITAGIGSAGPRWRTGLVRAFSRSAVGSKPQPMPSQDWRTEVNIGGTRVWLRDGPDNPGWNSSKTSVAIAGSVSRCEPLRKTATLWTSGNTVAVGVPIADSLHYLRDGLSARDNQSHNWLFSLNRALRAEEESAAELLDLMYPANVGVGHDRNLRALGL